MAGFQGTLIGRFWVTTEDSSARLAFEGAQQQALVLATHEDYEAVGARAWVYFEAKDADWRAALAGKRSGLDDLTPDKWLDDRISHMASVWESMAEGQGRLPADALVLVRMEERKRPDNWLHENLTLRHGRAYELFAARSGSAAPAQTVDLNQNLHKILCRETQARPRLDSFRILHDPARQDIKVKLLPRDPDQARRAITARHRTVGGRDDGGLAVG